MITSAATSKKQKYSRASLQASDRLLKAVKEKMLHENGKIDEALLRKQGYSEDTIARLKEI